MTEWSDRFERWLEEHFPAAQDLDDIAERYQTWRATLPPGDQLARTIAYCERLYLDGTDGIPYADFAKSARAEKAAKAAGRETPAVLSLRERMMLVFMEARSAGERIGDISVDWIARAMSLEVAGRIAPVPASSRSAAQDARDRVEHGLMNSAFEGALVEPEMDPLLVSDSLDPILCQDRARELMENTLAETMATLTRSDVHRKRVASYIGGALDDLERVDAPTAAALHYRLGVFAAVLAILRDDARPAGIDFATAGLLADQGRQLAWKARSETSKKNEEANHKANGVKFIREVLVPALRSAGKTVDKLDAGQVMYWQRKLFRSTVAGRVLAPSASVIDVEAQLAQQARLLVRPPPEQQPHDYNPAFEVLKAWAQTEPQPNLVGLASNALAKNKLRLSAAKVAWDAKVAKDERPEWIVIALSS